MSQANGLPHRNRGLGLPVNEFKAQHQVHRHFLLDKASKENLAS